MGKPAIIMYRGSVT